MCIINLLSIDVLLTQYTTNISVYPLEIVFQFIGVLNNETDEYLKH